MNILVEKQPKCVTHVRVEIPADLVHAERENILHNYSSRAKVPGFRPGKAPAAIVAKRYQKEIQDDLSQELKGLALREVREKEKLNLLEITEAKDLDFGGDGSVSYSVTALIAPEFDLPEYKGLTIQVPSDEVSDEELDREIEGIRQRFADYETVTDRGAEMGDYVIIDHQTTFDGKPLDEFLGYAAGSLSGASNHWLYLDEKIFLPGFAPKLVGMSSGDTREVEMTMADDFELDVLRGQKLDFSVQLKEIKRQVLPEIDEEFTQKLLNINLEDFKKFLREQLAAQRKRRNDSIKVERIIDELIKGLDFDLPELWVERETQSNADKIVENAIQSGVNENVLESQKSDLIDVAANRARANLRARFVLEQIADVEKITVNQGEIVSALSQQAKQANKNLKSVINQMRRSGELNNVYDSLVMSKTVDFLINQANLVVTENEEPSPAENV